MVQCMGRLCGTEPIVIHQSLHAPPTDLQLPCQWQRLIRDWTILVHLLFSEKENHKVYCDISKPGLFPAILGKGPWPKLGKNDRLNIKIGRN